jgi:hypothetical protein
MRNIYRRARIKTAKRDTSANALTRESLSKPEEEESDFERRKRLQKEVLASVRRFRASDRLNREAIHDRNALR